MEALGEVGKSMKPKHFLNQIESHRVTDAIAKVESRTSGEVRVMISHKKRVDDVFKMATREFSRLKMMNTKERNAVLIFVVPLCHSFAVIGDEGVHRKCGDFFWTETAEIISQEFKKGRFTEGLVRGIEKVGEALIAHFPHKKNNQSEISNKVVES